MDGCSLDPIRRGQGLSVSAGPYIRDQIAAAEKTGGTSAGAAAMVRLLETDHLNDQLAALAWLRKQSFVRSDRIAVAGNSFGGIEAVLSAERGELLCGDRFGRWCAKLGEGARIAIGHDSSGSKFQYTNFLFSSRERLRPIPEQNSFGSDESRA
jgi:hypothetical protein